MTPTQKALELFDKMLGQCAADNGDQAFILSKNCALIAVDELIGAICKHDSTAVWNYWQQVKTEIQYI